MPEYIYIWAYIQKHPQETKRFLGIRVPKIIRAYNLWQIT